ncbi:MAG: hypothetical protein JWM19_1655 [Actinomycetia bacterium]|nr:hypothetical protein [Actinomycetes bacterium]
MTSPIRERYPLPSTDVPAISGHLTATLHQAVAADGIRPATLRYAADGPASMLRLSVHTRDGVAVVSLHGELDSIGACILRTYLSDPLWPSRARCVVDLTGLSFIDRLLSWFEVYDTVEKAVAGPGERRPAGLKAAPAWQ